MRRLTILLVVALVATGCTATTSAPRPRAASTPSTSATPPPRAVQHHLVVRRAPWRLPHPIAREAVAAGQGDGAVVVAGGLLPGDSSATTVYRLDLRTGRATPLPSLGTAVHDTAGTTVAGHALVIGGGNSAEQGVVQRQGRHGWRVVGHLPGPRSDLSSAKIGATTYVAGGYDGTSPALPDVLASTDGRRWRTVARLQVPVRYAATVVLGHDLWVLGGERDGAMVDAVQRLDTTTGRSRVVGHLRRPVGHAMAAVVGGRILLLGGRRSTDHVVSRGWWVDPATSRVTRARGLPGPLADAAVVTGPDGTTYLLGGETPTETRDVVEVKD